MIYIIYIWLHRGFLSNQPNFLIQTNFHFLSRQQVKKETHCLKIIHFLYIPVDMNSNFLYNKVIAQFGVFFFLVVCLGNTTEAMNLFTL